MALRSPSRLLLVLLVVVQVVLEPAAHAVCPGDVCTGELCTECASGQFVPDPKDCHSYYVCTGDGEYLPEPFLCPDGEVFSFDAQACKKIALGVPCPPCTQECVYECQSTDTLLMASSEDCSTYYECSEGTVTIKRCDDTTPFFDGTTCQTDETACCRCQPYCDGTDIYSIIDPIDCRKYWLCQIATKTSTLLKQEGPKFNTGKSVSAAKPSLHTDTSAPPAQPLLYTGTQRSRPEIFNTCPEGEVFDTATQQCSAIAACVTACPNAVNGTGCIDPFICFSTGRFAKCTGQCVQEYYECTEETDPDYQEPELCPTGTVLNPDTLLCINKDECPY